MEYSIKKIDNKPVNVLVDWRTDYSKNNDLSHAYGTLHFSGVLPNYVLDNWFHAPIQHFSGLGDIHFDYIPQEHLTVKTKHNLAIDVIMPDQTSAIHIDHLVGVNTWQWIHNSGTHISGKVDSYTLDHASFEDVRYEYTHDGNVTQNIYLSDFQTQHLRFVLPWLANHEQLSSNAIKQYGLGGKVQNLRLCWKKRSSAKWVL